MPLTPPVEKLLGNLKKYTPAASSSVPSVIISHSFSCFCASCFMVYADLSYSGWTICRNSLRQAARAASGSVPVAKCRAAALRIARSPSAVIMP